MKQPIRDLERKAAEAVRACLEGVPFVEIEGVDKERVLGGYRADLVAAVNTPSGSYCVVAEVKSVGEPRVAREAVNRLWRLRTDNPNVVPVFIAPYVSPRAAEICKKDDVGYVDLSGNCRLIIGDAFIEREGRPNIFAEKRDLRSLYSPKASRVLRVLLLDPRKAWTISGLAQEAEVSLGQAANVKKLLENREWVQKTQEGIVLREPGKLLAEWADNYSFRKNRVRDYYSLKSVEELEADLADACLARNLRYGLTGFSASARLAPAVRFPRAMVYVENPTDDLVLSAGLKEVPSGANLTLLDPYDAGVFFGNREIGGLRVVSPVQAYLDLKGFRGRGEEAAAKLLDEVIRPQW